jgi:Na+/H+-dicarboxylate symporter
MEIDIENKTKNISYKNKIFKYWTSSLNIFLFGVAGVLIGYFAGNLYALEMIGNIFIKLIRMLVVPIILVSIISAISQLSKTQSAGKVGVYSILIFFSTSLVAVLFGIFSGIIFKPGVGLSKLPEQFMNGEETYNDPSATQIVGFWDFLLGIIPSNPIKALTDGNIVQILVFAIFFGVALSYLNNKNKDKVLHAVDAINDALLWMMSKIIFLAPIGVLGLMTYSVGALGLDLLVLALKLVIVYAVISVIFAYGFLGLLVKLFSNIPYIEFFKKTIPLKIISFTTASSLVSVPTNLRCADSMKLNPNLSRFIIPLGATVNMNGNAMFYSISTIFFAQMFNIDISLGGYTAIALISILGAVATAGVPGPTILIVAVLVAANIPLVGIPLLFAIDRVFDMIRTTVNVLGDLATVAILDKNIKQ